MKTITIICIVLCFVGRAFGETASECGVASEETTRIMQGLAPHCDGCHSTGKRGYFASPAAFHDLLASDPKLVIPGDPENSELVKLLEGRSTGPFRGMPTGVKSYAQLLDEGLATFPLADVKHWIATFKSQGRIQSPNATARRVTRMSATQVQKTLYQQLGLTYDTFFKPAFSFGIEQALSKSELDYPLQSPDAFPAPWYSIASERFHGLGGGSFIKQMTSDDSLSPTFVLTITQLSQRWCKMAVQKPNNTALFPSGTSTGTQVDNVKSVIRRWFLHFHARRASDADVDLMYSNVWIPLATQGADVAWTGLCSTFIRHPDWIFY